jgi:hypothetical protein
MREAHKESRVNGLRFRRPSVDMPQRSIMPQIPIHV